MSTDLSKRKFTDSAQNGAFSWLFEGFRTRMRDTAKTVRMEAAWRTWPTIHKVAKALHETLVTEGDLTAARADNVATLTERLERFHPTPDRFPAVGGNMEKWRQDIALTLGISNTDDPALLNDVIAAYETKHGDVIAAAEAAEPDPYHKQVDGWEALNQAVGGDLWDNPEKLATMRKIDKEMTGATWNEFHNAVVDATTKIRDVASNPSLDL